MLHILDTRPPADAASAAFEFCVYRSPKDGETVLGYLAPYGVVSDRRALWVKTDFGVPVAEAFLQTLGLAEHYGVETVWVNDPDGLFPPAARPVRELREERP